MGPSKGRYFSKIAAVAQTTAKILIEEADFFYPITEEYWFSYNKNTKKRKTTRKKSSSRKK